MGVLCCWFFFFKQKTAYEMLRSLVGSEMCIRDRLSQGQTVQEAVRQLGIAEQTYYRWRKEYGGLDKSQAARLKELERENLRLKQLVAELSLDKSILEEALSKK